MINKIKDIPDGTEVWVKMRRVESCNDDDRSIRFCTTGPDGICIYLDDGDEVLTEEQIERILHLRDDTDGLCFHDVNGCISWVTDDDTFYTLDDLKQLANDGMPNDNMPKQGDDVQVEVEGLWLDRHFIAFYKGKIITDNYINHSNNIAVHAYTNWRYPPKKTELTLAEIEEKLGLEKGYLIIKD